MTKDTVNIHGKEYETVASRVARFRETYKFDYSIETKLVSADEKMVVMKAWITDLTKDRVVATGYAEESRTSSSINRTSALENCETSAIGRALAAFGMAGTEYASADEVAQAIHQQTTQPKQAYTPSQPLIGQATPKQKLLINDKLNDLGIADEDKSGYLIENYGLTETENMSKGDASMIIDDLIESTKLAVTRT